MERNSELVPELISYVSPRIKIKKKIWLVSAPAAGGSDDWAKETLQVKYVYLIELRPQLECKWLSEH